MGLFDSIIGTAKADSEDPTPFVLVADEREEFVPFVASGGGGGGTGTGSGTGNGNGSGGGSGSGSGTGDGTGDTGTGNGSGWGFDGDRKEANPLAFAHVEEPIITEKVEEPAEVNIDIGGDLTDLIPEIPESVVITSETPTAPSDILITDEVSPLSESDE